MKAIEVWRNGEKLFTAGLEKGIVTARLIIRNQVDPIRFDVVGRDSLTGGHVPWGLHWVETGDEFTLKLVEVQSCQKQ
jgi:hypothetical protein